MAKYIDREALIEWLKRIPLIDLSDGRGLCRVIMEDDFKKAIKKMPKGIIADVTQVRHGRWIKDNNSLQTDDYYCCYFDYNCSECGKVVNNRYELPKYCPNCGAKMDG